MIKSVSQFLEFLRTEYSEKTAFRWFDEASDCVQSATYPQFAEDTQKFACYLKQRIPETAGKHIGILSSNSYHYVVAMYGIILADAVAVTLNTEENWNTIDYQIQTAELSCIFCDDEYLDAEPNLSISYGAIVHNIEEYTQLPQGEWLEDSTDPERLALLLFTSGTTSKSKGVMLPKRCLFHGVIRGCIPPNALYPTEHGRCTDWKTLLITPLYHVAIQTMMQGWLLYGSTVQIVASRKYIYRDMKKMPSDHAFVVPAIMNMWYKDIKRGRIGRLNGLHSIMTGGAAANPEEFDTFQENGIQVTQAYGLTETFSFGTSNYSADSDKYGSIGKPDDACEVKIIDDEICIRGECVMQGYYKEPESTTAAIQDGWFHTGDLGSIDSEGYVYITGRKKNLIILSSGENISPEELENLISRVSEVQEVVVKEKNGKICAEIFCDMSAAEKIEEQIDGINKQVAMYKRIGLIEYRDTPFPRTGSGKIKRV